MEINEPNRGIYWEGKKTPGFSVAYAHLLVKARSRKAKLSLQSEISTEQRKTKIHIWFRFESSRWAASHSPARSFVSVYKKLIDGAAAVSQIPTQDFQVCVSVSLLLFTFFLKLSVSIFLSLSLCQYFSQLSLSFPQFLAVQTGNKRYPRTAPRWWTPTSSKSRPRFSVPRNCAERKRSKQSIFLSFTTRFSEIIGRFNFLDHMP
jgi:hypothetical protein